MTSVKRSDVKSGTILDALEQAFTMTKAFEKVAVYPDQYFEFTLEELGLPSAEELLAATKAIEAETGLRGWVAKDHLSETYKGFSLCYNPEVGVDPFATLGDSRLVQVFSRVEGLGDFKDLRNTYHDSYSFTSIHPSVAKHYGKMLSCFKLHPTRSRAAYLIPASDAVYGESTWHRDEFVFQNLRMNIPLQTEEAYVLEIKGSDEYGNSFEILKHLEVGKAYMWNTRIPHRVFANKPVQSAQPRIHIVLGFMPWFSYNDETGEFTPNEFFGIHPFELVKSRAIFNSC